jgi:hypothetical protein
MQRSSAGPATTSSTIVLLSTRIPGAVRRSPTSDPSSRCAATSGRTAISGTERVEGVIPEAQALLDLEHIGPATSVAHTAVEIIVGDLVVRRSSMGPFFTTGGRRSSHGRSCETPLASCGGCCRSLPKPGNSISTRSDSRAGPRPGWLYERGHSGAQQLADRADPVTLHGRPRGGMRPRVTSETRRARPEWPANPRALGPSVGGLTVQLYERRDPTRRADQG